MNLLNLLLNLGQSPPNFAQYALDRIACKMSAVKSKGGCASCRMRKKKCDMERPVCRGCTRNKLICCWPTSVTTHRTGSSAAQSNVKNHVKVWQLSSKQEVLPIRTTTGSKTSAQQHRPAAKYHRAEIASIVAVPNDTRTFLRTESRSLLDHYILRTANVLSITQGNNNPFMAILLPLSQYNDLVLQSVLVVSGVHLLQKGGVSSELHAATWSHYAVVLRSLKHGLTDLSQKDHEQVLSLLLSSLLLYFAEAARGDVTGALLQHLHGAYLLLTIWLDYPDSYQDVDLRDFIIEFYCYAASQAAFTLDGSGHGEAIKESANLMRGVQERHSRFFGTLCGCSHSLFALMPRVAHLSRLAKTELQTKECHSPAAMEMYIFLRSEVLSWSPEPEEDRNIMTLGEVFRAAMLLVLDLPFVGPNQDEYIEHSFGSLVQLLDRLPCTAPVATTLAWPIFVFGFWAFSDDQQSYILSKLAVLRETFGMSLVSVLMQQLQLLWTQTIAQRDMDIFLCNSKVLVLS